MRFLDRPTEHLTTNDQLIRMWVVDDNDSFRGLLSSLIETEAGFECTRQFPSALALLAALKHHSPPDVILMDIEMPGLSGVDAVQGVKALAPATPVFIMTTFYDHHYKTRALRDGASGFFLKSAPLADMLGLIRRIHQQPSMASLGFASSEAHESENLKLSDRDRSGWPMRRAPAAKDGRAVSDGASQLNPDPGRRATPWHCASIRLVRGVSQLRGLFRMTH